MKGFWVIVIMIITLVPFFMLSRYLEKSIEMAEDDMVLPVIDEEEMFFMKVRLSSGCI